MDSETSNEPRGLSALPPVMIIGLAATVAVSITWLLFAYVDGHEKWFERIFLALPAAGFAATLLSAAGVYELARRTTGGARRALTVAAALFVASTVMSLAWSWVFTLWRPEHIETIDKVLRYIDYALDLGALAALVVAAWARQPLAISGGVLVLISRPPPPLHDWIATTFRGDKTFSWIHAMLGLLFVAGTAVVAIGAARGTPVMDPPRASKGLHQVGSSLIMRVIAVVVGTGLVLLLALGHAGQGAADIVKLTVMAALVLNALAQLQMTRGALNAAGAELGDLPRWSCAIAAGVAAWTAGVLLIQTPQVYQMLYGKHDSFSRDSADALSLAMPLAVVFAVASVMLAISTLANRRGDKFLQTQVSGKGIGFVMLMLSSIAIQVWIVPKAESESGLMMMMFCAAGAGLWALMLGGRLCHLAGDAVEAEPGLPPAKLV